MLSFSQFLNEGRGFELGGSKYSSGFGRYTKDGKSISKEEYMKASAEYKGDKPSASSPKKSSEIKRTTNNPLRYITPTEEELENRTQKPEHSDTNGVFSITAEVRPETNGGEKIKTFKVAYKKNIKKWFEEFCKQVDANTYIKDKDAWKVHNHFMGWVKHNPAEELEYFIDNSISTSSERINAFDEFMTVVDDYVENNFEFKNGTISKKKKRKTDDDDYKPRKKAEPTKKTLDDGSGYERNNTFIDIKYPNGGVRRWNFNKYANLLYKRCKHEVNNGEDPTIEKLASYIEKTVNTHVFGKYDPDVKDVSDASKKEIRKAVTDTLVNYATKNFEKIQKKNK